MSEDSEMLLEELMPAHGGFADILGRTISHLQTFLVFPEFTPVASA
jgi:hypothetical protein